MSDISENWKNLKPEIGNFIGQLNSESGRLEHLEKELQEKIDEAYNKGLQDAQNAVKDLYNFNKLSSDKHLYDVFGKTFIANIIMECPMSEIIEKLNQLKSEEENKKQVKEQELHVGDEVEYIEDGQSPEKRIVIGINNGIDDEKIIWSIGLDLFSRYWTSSTNPRQKYRKTGKHYDSIPFPKEIK